MATPAPSQPAPARKKKAPPSLSNAYQKAHKTYVLSSALLASWQLIGIELNTKEKWGVELKSPNAVPFVLLAMIIYFGYRLTVEWMQCDEERRSNRAANVDFVVAHTIAGLALLISLTQYLLRIRIADIISHAPDEVKFTAVGFSFLPFVPSMISRFRKTESLVDKVFFLGESICILLLSIIGATVMVLSRRWLLLLLTAPSAAFLGVSVRFLFRTLPRVMQKRRLAKLEAQKPSL